MSSVKEKIVDTLKQDSISIPQSYRLTVVKCRDREFQRCEHVDVRNNASHNLDASVMKYNLIQTYGFADMLSLPGAEITYAYVFGKPGAFGDVNLLTRVYYTNPECLILQIEYEARRLLTSDGDISTLKETLYVAWYTINTSKKYDVFLFNAEGDLTAMSILTPDTFVLGQSSNLRWLEVDSDVKDYEAMVIAFTNCSYWYENKIDNENYIKGEY